MNYSKTKQEIELIRKAGYISAIAMKEVEKMLQPGVSTLEIDKVVEEIFKNNGAESAFKK